MGVTRGQKPRALLAAWDKEGFVELGRALVNLGWEVISTGRSLISLQNAEVAARSVADVSGVPELLGGRVKTLHPAIHAGILADRSELAHLDELAAAGITPIDLVVTNFYPFVENPSLDTIDIGGPALVRAAAKNYEHVGVVVDPADYSALVTELTAGPLSFETRRRLARKAFAYTAAYEAAITAWFDRPQGHGMSSAFPDTIHLTLAKTDELRLGENPHQYAARYRVLDEPSGWWDTATQHHGLPVSYLNLYDADAAWRLVYELGRSDNPAAAIVKHGNPCGAAVGETIESAWTRAYEGDVVSAFGGIVALNRPVHAALAKRLRNIYTIVVIAPGYDDDALRVLQERRDLRILSAMPPVPRDYHVRSVDGGLLFQTADAFVRDADGSLDRSGWNVVTQRAPVDAEWRDLELAWQLAARVASSSIVIVKDGQAVGIGAGQPNRRDAGRIAKEKAGDKAVGGAFASDGFLPFRDALEAATEAGCTAVIQPGGSARDHEIVAAADEAGLTMVFTGIRHFRH